MVMVARVAVFWEHLKDCFINKINKMMKSDKERAAADKYPGIEESAVFEDNQEKDTSNQHLYIASDEEIKESVCKVNPDDGTLDRG